MSAAQPQPERSDQQRRIEHATSHLLNVLAGSGEVSLDDIADHDVDGHLVQHRLRQAATQLSHTCPPPQSSRWPWWGSAAFVVVLFTSMVVAIGAFADDWLADRHNALFFMIWSLIVLLGAFGIGLASVIAWTTTPRRSRR